MYTCAYKRMPFVVCVHNKNVCGAACGGHQLYPGEVTGEKSSSGALLNGLGRQDEKISSAMPVQ